MLLVRKSYISLLCTLALIPAALYYKYAIDAVLYIKTAKHDVFRPVLSEQLYPIRDARPACDFFLSIEKFRDPTCPRHIPLAAEVAKHGGCVPPSARTGCPPSTILLAHTWVQSLDGSSRPRLELLLRAWLKTQDLRRSRFYLWTTGGRVSDNKTAFVPDWLHRFAPYVTLRQFDYDHEAQATPLALSRHFAAWETINATTHGLPGLQSDLIRNILVHNYGGLWLDTDAVPLRDLWDITQGLGLHFIPKFRGRHANGHVLFAPCPRSPLSRRRLEAISMYPWNITESWPRASTTGLKHWIWNDAISEHVRASQSIKYNLTHQMEAIDGRALSAGAWNDIEFAFPMQWFDPLWTYGGPKNTTEFRRRMVCSGAYIWHRLTKHAYRDSTANFGAGSGCDALWDEIFSDEIDVLSVQARVLTGSERCD
jgi:hypothetical protein